MSFHVPEQYRYTGLNPFGTKPEDGNNGMFSWRVGALGFRCIVSDQGGWEHVSVGVHQVYRGKDKPRIPTWDEMCMIKSLFWDDEDVVVQYHPKKSEYVQNVSYALHLWRPVDGEMPRPPFWMVGSVGAGVLA